MVTPAVTVGSDGLNFLGGPIPPATDHAIITSLPTWRDNIGLVEHETRVLQSLTTGYPRFFAHKSIQRLSNFCEKKFAVNGDKCVLYPSKRAAEECREFMLSQGEHAGTPESVKLVQYSICPEESAETRYQSADLHIVLFPATMFISVIEFWRYTGLGISSRFAEHCLSLLPDEDTEQDEPSSTTSPSKLMSKDRTTYSEEQHSLLNPGASAKHVLRRRIAGLLSGSIQDISRESCTTNVPQDTESESGSDGIEDDVYLFPTGMAAIWNTHQLCLRARPPAKSVCLGFLYVDTIKVLEGWGPGAHFFGHGLDSDIDALEKLLNEEITKDPTKPPILALYTEFPSNPLLRSADMRRLRALANSYNFLLVVDDTVGNFVNVDILQYADILVTSLTKVFSGGANVMGGSLVLNPRGRHYAALKSQMATYEDTYFDEDALVLEYNSRDVVRRVRIIDENADTLCAFLLSRSVVVGAPSAVIKEVHYPKYTTPAHYLRCKRPRGGYGGLFSITFTSLAAAMAFFDALPCHKGMMLGTNFTLATVYVALAYHAKLEWAAQYGVKEESVRISVGMEDINWLLHSFDTALKAAESA